MLDISNVVHECSCLSSKPRHISCGSHKGLVFVRSHDVIYGSPGFDIIPLTLNDHYSGRTAPLTSKRCILYIYSTNIGTEYFKHGVYSPFFFLFKMQLVS